jgi:hypothetical protein
MNAPEVSGACEAVVNRLKEDDTRALVRSAAERTNARVAALVSVSGDFGYSHDLHTTSVRLPYSYGGFITSAPHSAATQYREPALPNELKNQLVVLRREVYFVRDLAFKDLFKIACLPAAPGGSAAQAGERLKAGWNGAVGRIMLKQRGPPAPP